MTPRNAAPSREQLDALREAFIAWSENHGVVWFEDDHRLAETIAAVVGVTLDFGGVRV